VSEKYLIGLGSYTMGDDSIGLRLVERLAELGAPGGFEPVVASQDALSILSYFHENTRRVLMVDCVRAGRNPGDWVCFSPADVETVKRLDRMTTHEGDALSVIDMASRLGLAVPEIRVFGIEPESVGPGLELSETLQRRFEEYLQAIGEQATRDDW
jgi:hydrogenase maturation protease